MSDDKFKLILSKAFYDVKIVRRSFNAFIEMIKEKKIREKIVTKKDKVARKKFKEIKVVIKKSEKPAMNFYNSADKYRLNSFSNLPTMKADAYK